MKKDHHNIGLRSPMPKTKLDKLIEWIRYMKKEIDIANDPVDVESVNMAKQFFETVDEEIQQLRFINTHSKEKWEKLRKLLNSKRS